MIDLSITPDIRSKNIQFCRDNHIVLPTFAMMKNPETIPESIKKRLKTIGLWDIDPANLFRITWKNTPVTTGGAPVTTGGAPVTTDRLFGSPNHLVLPPALTGCPATIIMMTGKWFPTGAHKVGATYGCLVPGLVTGQFDPETTKAVWPSTGNYCRGGAYISALLSAHAVAILPREMSRERFEWLDKVAGEVITTPGCESNVKEIFDKCHELRASGDDLHIFNQFDELGNPLWHYAVTGPAVEEVLSTRMAPGQRFAGYVSASGSGGTLGAGYYLKKVFPRSKVVAAEALQCPTLLNNGFGDHRIEGIGDKHVPWVHDCKETDFVAAVDDAVPMRLLRLFNEEAGKQALAAKGLEPALIDRLDLLGISGIANMVAAVKFAKYLELTDSDLIVSVATDSMDLYGSRLSELTQIHGPYKPVNAQLDLQLLNAVTVDHFKELTYPDKKAMHNLKYYTWVEQQGKTIEALNAQWYDHDRYWGGTFDKVEAIDALITRFNTEVGLLA